MPITCTPLSLASAAKCFLYLPPRIRKSIRVLVYCNFINGDTMDCSPEALAEAATCFAASLSDGQLDAIETYLSCEVANSGGGGGGGAPTNATYITQIANATLTNEQALAALATGLLKGATGTGVVSIATPKADYAIPLVGAGNPEGVVTASPGQTYLDTAGDSFWMKKSGVGDTGWLQLIA